VPVTAIEIDSVTKIFKIYKEKPHSAKERVIKLGRNPHEKFKALDDVSFTVTEGQTMAILGHNGSGKSTLLKCVAGTLRPTSGRITVRGRLAALLELGAGFHGELTGRENVYLNGSILGFSKPQVERIFDDIVDFAELAPFIDTQVKHYSSGMYARLGFAVAIHVEPEILVVDEVLSVGDEAFQRKCIERVKQFQREGRTILLVTHVAELVRQIADQAAVLDHGHLVDVNEPGHAIRTFRETLAQRGLPIPDELTTEPTPTTQPTHQPPTNTLKLTNVHIDYPNPHTNHLTPDQPLRIHIDYTTPHPITDIAFTLEAHDQTGNLMISTDTETTNMPIPTINGTGTITFDIERLPLLDGTYPLTISAHTRNGGTTYDRRDQIDQFHVMNPTKEQGMVHINLKIIHHPNDPADPS
jgi:ABC-2 type transport system ATP-binding protein